MKTIPAWRSTKRSQKSGQRGVSSVALRKSCQEKRLLRAKKSSTA